MHADGTRSSRWEGRGGVFLVFLGFTVVWFILWTGADILSSMRTTRYPLYLPIETRIPFVRWVMPVYFSLDLAVVILPFLFKSWRGALPPMATMAVQTAIAAPFFVFLPIEVGFTGEAVHGIWGEYVTDPLGVPNHFSLNHVPSLHVTFAFTIAVVAGRNWGHAVLWLGMLWACAVSVSTVLVHEHHLLDVLGGLVLFLVTVPIILPFFERVARTRPEDPD